MLAFLKLWECLTSTADTYRVSLAQGPDVEEGECLLGLKDLQGRDFA